MMDRIVMEVSRYRPEIESAPTFQAYEVPLTREWAVLDGLTYIKDHLDGTLSFRWSCRMGICGSSGMTINGDPKLACATFLADYLPGPVRVEPMRNFPVIRDLVVDISDFMAKLPSVKPWLVRHDEPPVEDGEYRQTPAELDAFKQFSMCINCMLCYSACPVYALDPDFLGPARSRWGSGTTWTRATKVRRIAGMSWPRPTALGRAPWWANVRRLVRKASILPARSSATS